MPPIYHITHITRRKQAEFLVHGRFPWAQVVSIGVVDSEMAGKVRTTLAGATRKPPVTIEPNWYYN